jgi:hypothetical protein
MNRYEVHYHYGHDRDDWRTMSFVATDIESARNLAIKLVPMDYNIGRVYEKEPFKFNPMEQTKIQNLTPQGTFDANGKTFYKFDCILENGMVGEVNALSADKWSIGDEVVVKEHQQTKWGPRLKLDRPGFTPGGAGSGGGSRSSDPDATKGIIASWAVGVAMQVVGDPTQNHYEEAVLLASRIALRCRGIIKDEVTP